MPNNSGKKRHGRKQASHEEHQDRNGSNGSDSVPCAEDEPRAAPAEKEGAVAFESYETPASASAMPPPVEALPMLPPAAMEADTASVTVATSTGAEIPDSIAGSEAGVASITIEDPAGDSSDNMPQLSSSFHRQYSGSTTRKHFERKRSSERWWPVRCCLALIQIALPVTFSVSLTNAAFVFTIYFAAHTLNRVQFAGLAMGISFSNITANALGVGLSCALDTLCSQEYGRDPESKKIGLYLQRSFVASIGVFVPLTVAYWFSQPVLAAVIQPDIALYAALWLKWSVAVSLPTVLTTCIQKYVQCHGDPGVVLYSAVVGTVTVPFFLHHLSPYGVPGFIAALSLNRLGVFVALGVFALWKKEFRKTWPGWSWECLSWPELKEYMYVGLPSMAAFCADLWGFEAMAVMAGHLGSLEVAVWMVVINIYNLFWGPCVGICSAAAVRVGNALGCGDAVESLRMLKCSLFLSGTIGAVCCWISIAFGSPILHILQDDREVIQRSMHVLFFNGISLFLDIQFYVLQGIFRGCGKQNLAAVFVAIGHWAIGIPISAILALYYNYNVEGILIGFCTGMAVICPVFLFNLFWRFDWDQMAADISNGEEFLRDTSATASFEENDANERSRLVRRKDSSELFEFATPTMTPTPGPPAGNSRAKKRSSAAYGTFPLGHQRSGSG